MSDIFSLIRHLLKLLSGTPASLPPPPRIQIDVTNQPSEQYGKMVYSSKPQEELEKEEGEKLFKVSGGVYVNQTTYDQIQSEYQPVIEHEIAADFFTLNYEKAGIACATWHPDEPKLIGIMTSPDALYCLVFNLTDKQLALESETKIDVRYICDKIEDVAHHPSLSYVLITCDTQLIIWDYVTHTLIANIETDDYKVRKGGFYPDAQYVWALSLNKHRTADDWLIWDYSTNEIIRYAVQTYDHYSRGSMLHPSGLLIGALWNTYECGYLIHILGQQRTNLYYHSKPAPQRPEYEAYSPCFSPDGKYFAMVANPYLAMHKNHSKVCIYDIETADLELEFYTGTSLTERQLQFVGSGNTLAFREYGKNALHVFNSGTGKKLKTLNAPSTIRYFAGHRLAGYYAVVHETGVSIFFSALEKDAVISTQNFDERALDVAKRFSAANEAYLVKVTDYGSNAM